MNKKATTKKATTKKATAEPKAMEPVFTSAKMDEPSKPEESTVELNGTIVDVKDAGAKVRAIEARARAGPLANFPVFEDVVVPGSNNENRTVHRLVEECFDPEDDWRTAVRKDDGGVEHRYLERRMVNGETGLRPDSFLGDDEILRT